MKNSLSDWLTEDLQIQIREVFEPRYKRSLTNEEVADIANNLTGIMEIIMNQKWNSYEQKGK